MWATEIIPGGASSIVSDYGSVEDVTAVDSVDDGSGPLMFGETTAYVTPEGVMLYQANKVWAALLVLTALILQICAIWGLVLTYTSRAPNILGYVSSLTRDNPFLTVPEGGNILDGLERARLLAKVRVPVGDVQPASELGHVAFMAAGKDGRLRQQNNDDERMYL